MPRFFFKNFPMIMYHKYTFLTDVVMACGHEPFEHAIETLKKKVRAKQDTDLTAYDLKVLVDKYKAVYKKAVGKLFPQDPNKQLEASINAVFSDFNHEAV